MCRANFAAGLSLTFFTNPTDQFIYSAFIQSVDKFNTDYLKVNFSEKIKGDAANVTSQLCITDIVANGTNATCEAFIASRTEAVNFTVCVVGNK